MKKKLGILALILAGMVVTACGDNNSSSVSVSDPASENSAPTSASTSNGSTSNPSTLPSTSTADSESASNPSTTPSTSASNPSTAPSTSTSTSIDTTVHVTGVNVDNTSVELTEGDTHQVVATVLPEDATDKSVAWSSSDEGIATVSDSGLITAISEGNATITVTTTDGAHTATISVTVTKAIVHVTSVSLNETDIEIEEGETATLLETVLPEDATDKSVTWATGDEEVATVDGGVVTALKEGSTTVTVTTTDGGFTATANVVVTKHYEITVNEAPGIESVSVTDKAKEGELVELTLTYDDEAIIVEKVMANDIVCGTKDGSYYFFMPAEAVEINVITSTIVNHYVIKSDSNSVVLDKAVAAAGEEVNLSFTLAPGYNFNGEVTVYKGDPNVGFAPVTIPSTFENGIITFTMPDDFVTVSVSISSAYFRMTKTADEFNHINTVTSDGATVRADGSSYDIKYNTAVKIAFTQNDSYLRKARPIGIYIPELDRTIMTSEDPNSVSFTMPYFDISIEVITEKVYRTFTIVNSEHITATAYQMAEDGSYVALDEYKAVYDEYVYLKVESSDPETYVVKSIRGTYYSSYSATVTPSLQADGYYRFAMPEVTRDTLELVITEKNISLYAGAAFLGNYKGFNSCNNNHTSATVSLSIDASGEFTKGSDVYNITSVGNNELNMVKEGNADAIARAYFDDKMVATTYTPGKNIVSNDMNIFFKVADGDTLTVYAQRAASKYHIGQIYKNGEADPYVTYFINPDNGEIHTNVTFEFTTGSHVNDNAVDYTIKDSEGRKLAVVTGTSQSSRTVTLFNGLEGEYDIDGETLIVNTTNAVYDGHTWSYTITEDRTIRMQYADEEKIHIMVVVLGDGTATIQSSTEEDLAPVYKKAFMGKTAYNYSVQIYFNNPDKAIVYCTYSDEPRIPASSGDAYNGYDAEASYSYDSATGDITLVTKGDTIVFHLEDDGSLTIVSGAITYFTGGAVNSSKPKLTEFTPDLSRFN